MDNPRANNGGNSTKAVRPDDKRLNPTKRLLSKYVKEGFDFDKLKKLLDKLYEDGLDGDTKSTTLFLSYILGKPKESVDITSDDKPLNSVDYSKLSIEALREIAKLTIDKSDTGES